jgi:hypothetical protein
MHVADYLYQSILSCESPVGLCRPPTDVASAAPVHQNFARIVGNPTRGETIVEFGLVAKGRVEIGIYDLAGRRVHTMTNAVYPAGQHRATWNRIDRSGSPVRPGVYFVRAVFPDLHYTSASKIMLLQ